MTSPIADFKSSLAALDKASELWDMMLFARVYKPVFEKHGKPIVGTRTAQAILDNEQITPEMIEVLGGVFDVHVRTGVNVSLRDYEKLMKADKVTPWPKNAIVFSYRGVSHE